MENGNEMKPVANEEMSLTELRQIISGNMQFTFKINDDVEIILRELSQKELIEVDKELAKRDISVDPTSSEYLKTIRVVKIAYALEGFNFKGKPIKLNKDLAKIEELLWSLGEGVIVGLFVQYEGTIAEKFQCVQKKN
jgi:hypothetical protein